GEVESDWAFNSGFLLFFTSVPLASQLGRLAGIEAGLPNMAFGQRSGAEAATEKPAGKSPQAASNAYLEDVAGGKVLAGWSVNLNANISHLQNGNNFKLTWVKNRRSSRTGSSPENQRMSMPGSPSPTSLISPITETCVKPCCRKTESTSVTLSGAQETSRPPEVCGSVSSVFAR